MPEETIGLLLDKGILGLAVIASISVSVYLYKKVEALWQKIHDLLREHTKEIREIQQDKEEYAAEVVKLTISVQHSMDTLVKIMTSVKEDK